MRERRLKWLAALKALGDAVLIALSFSIAYWLRYDLQLFLMVEPGYHVPFRVYIPSVLLLDGILLLVFWTEGAYRPARGRLWLDEFSIILRSTLIGVAAMIVIIFLATPGYYSRLIFGYTGIIILVLMGVARSIEAGLRTRQRRHGIGVVRVLVVGVGEMARSFMRTVVACPELGYEIVGFVDDDPQKASEIGRFRALGCTDDLPALFATQTIDEVVITLPWVLYPTILHLVSQCQQANVRVRIVPDLFQMTLNRVVIENVNGIPLLGLQDPALHEWQALVKRAIDVIVSALGLVILAPLFAVVALAIKLDSPGPVIFSQQRVGRNGKVFTFFKFRSMCAGAETQVDALRGQNEATGPLFKIRHDPRLTRVGRVLRRASLDEFPQLWNVLKGDMSLIGPRPPLPDEVKAYAPWHTRRLEVLPGMTGLWQVSGRSDLTFDEMVLLDIYYIENWSPLLDIRVLFKTIPTMFWGPGAY